MTLKQWIGFPVRLVFMTAMSPVFLIGYVVEVIIRPTKKPDVPGFDAIKDFLQKGLDE